MINETDKETCNLDEKIEIRSRRKQNWTWVENEIFKDERFKAHHKLVYTVLCHHADNKTYQCYPSLKTIVQESSYNKHTVIKAIKDLEEWRYISKETHKKEGTESYMPNTYTIHGPTREGGAYKTQGVVHMRHKGGAYEAQGVVHMRHSNYTHINKTNLTKLGVDTEEFNIVKEEYQRCELRFNEEEIEKHIKRYGFKAVKESLRIYWETDPNKITKNEESYLIGILNKYREPPKKKRQPEYPKLVRGCWAHNAEEERLLQAGGWKQIKLIYQQTGNKTRDKHTQIKGIRKEKGTI